MTDYCRVKKLMSISIVTKTNGSLILKLNARIFKDSSPGKDYASLTLIHISYLSMAILYHSAI